MTCTTLGIDGRVSIAEPVLDQCCPVGPCDIDPCGLTCGFISLLPSGPLWDIPKQTAISHAKCDEFGINHECPDDLCRSLVSHSMYTASRLYDMITNVVWPRLRESSPDTAITTLDDWLDRLGWQDCYQVGCRDPRITGLSAFEIQSDCGPVSCDYDFPEELVLAVKRGIVRSLSRLQQGIIPTIDTLSFVLEPLGVQIRSKAIYCANEDGVLQLIPNTCCDVNIEVAPIDGTIEKAELKNCPATELQRQEPVGGNPVSKDCGGQLTYECIGRMDASFFPNDGNCNGAIAGAPEVIFLNVMAAECIVRSVVDNCSIVTVHSSCKI